MAKQYEVIELSFVNGGLRQPGYQFTADIEKPGPNLKVISDKPDAPAGTQTTELPELFKAKHNGPGVGAGNWAVEKVEDGSRASVVFKKDDGDAKAKAEAEAARLNAGGDIVLVVTEDAPSSGQNDAPAGTQTTELPDA